MSNSNKSILLEAWEAATGKACVEVYGGCWGSHFSILIGKSKVHRNEIDFRGKKEISELLSAEIELCVQAPAWNLYDGANLLCCAETENGYDSPMYLGFQRLIGQELTSVAIDDRLNLEVRFSNNFWLQVFCADELESSIYNYSLKTGRQIYTVYESAKLRVHPRDPPWPSAT